MGDLPPMTFQTCYQGTMLMYHDLAVVADYLNSHEGWFKRCAEPMQAEPLTENGYLLTVGKFGSFGYDVVPRIAVVLDAPVGTCYKMYNVEIPDEPEQSYAIAYNAEMNLSEIAWGAAIHNAEKAAKLLGDRPVPETITQVDWHLHLEVQVQFPPFIYKIPRKLLQSTGDRLLSSIVAQISPRLTSKVQQDFHRTHNLPKPPKSASCCTHIPVAPQDATAASESNTKENLTPAHGQVGCIGEA